MSARHERFAQELAKGASAARAYKLAGYKGDRTAASRLSTNVNISARVAELKSAAAGCAIITTAALIEDAGGIQVEALSDQKYSAAVAALIARAKLAGLLPAPKPEPEPLDLTRLSDDQLDQLQTLLAIARGEEAPPPESEASCARERVIAKIDAIRERAEQLAAMNGMPTEAQLKAKIDNLESQVAVLMKLNADLEARLAMEVAP